MASIKLIQLNIERDKHLEQILPFLLEQEPDVVCVQEIADHSVKRFTEGLGLYGHFVPMNTRADDGVPHIQGIALFSTIPFTKTWSVQYAGNTSVLPTYNGDTPESKHTTQRFELAYAELLKDDVLFRIATTHFPWTAEGGTTDFQREDMEKMIHILAENGEVVLAGDFNAPRGGEIFSLLAAKYKDNVPAEYTSSIDGALHRAGPLELMVDSIFSSPRYSVTDVAMHTGVSDHCAIVSTIETEN